MSREQRVRDLINKWQPRLGLQSWDIRYVDEAVPKAAARTAMAAANQADLTQHAQVWVDPAAPDTALENLVLHELGHIVTAPLTDFASEIAAHFGGKAAPLFLNHISNAEEVILNTYAKAITGQNPLFGKFVKDRKLSAWGYVKKERVA